jgi:hypothetical protein
LDIGAHNFNYESQFADCRNIYIYSDLSGTGNIVSSSGSSEIILRGSDNGFSGDLTINGYGISIFADSMLGFDSTITMNGSSRLNLASSSDYTFDISEIIMNSSLEGSIRANPFVSNSCGGGLGDPSTTTVAGDLTLLTSTSFTGYNNLIIEGTFTDNANSLTTVTGSTGSITTSEGTVETEATSITINTDDKSTAFLSILNKQTVVLNGERGNVYVNSGGILKGNGSADSIFVYDGGTIAPGLSPGCLTITGNGLSIDSGTYQVEIQGNTVCTEYDQVDVTGAVNLSNDPTLNVSFLSSFVPALNDEFVIINNDAADVVTGTFTGLVEGATILVDGVTFQISYIGGDGNDVVLTATAVPAAVAAPDTGVGQLLQNPVFTLFAVLMSAGTLIAFKKFQSAK